MSSEKQLRLDATQNTGLVLDRWVESLAQVLESMTDQKPAIRWKAVSGTAAEAGVSLDVGPESDTLWWEQPFPLGPGMSVWIAAPRSTWHYAGSMTLQAAGLDTVQGDEVRNTWLEILGQSLAALARSMGSILRREVICEGGGERSPSIEILEWATVSVSMGDAALAPLVVAFSPGLSAMLASPSRQTAQPDAAPAVEPFVAPVVQHEPSRTLDLLMDVDLPVSISFGKAQLPLKEVVKLTTGSIVELNRGVSEPVEILVNQRLIARGEVVVVEGNYGVRILEIVQPQDRLGSLS